MLIQEPVKNDRVLLEKKLARDPFHYESIIALADHYINSGDIARAAGTISKGLERYPLDVHVLNLSALIMFKAGMTGDAFKSLQLALKQDPDNKTTLQNLAQFSLSLSDWSNAIIYLQALEKRYPDCVFALIGLGTAYLRLGMLDKAEKKLKQAIELEPDNMTARINLGVTLRLLKKFSESEEHLKYALSRDPNNKFALNGLSSLYIDQHRMEEGIKLAEAALSVGETDPETATQAAYAYMKTREFQRAASLYDKALAIDPQNPEASLGKATVLLMMGRLKEGWRYYRCRFALMGETLDGPWPRWEGQDLKNKRVLVRAEQGAGDTIQFCRFLPLLKKKGAKIIFSCQPALGRLMSCFKEIAEIHASPRLSISDSEIDYQAALMDLPEHLGVDSIEHIPGTTPYLSVDKALSARWQERLRTDKPIKAGLIWAGNPSQTDDHNRSMHVTQLLPLRKFRQRVQFYSLQVGYAASQTAEFGPELSIIDLSSQLHDFAATAAAMINLDLIISVCTSTAHLSGALGRPTLILLPFVADWRWFLDRDDSPWYPTAKLIRQERPGDWKSVVERVSTHLEELLS